jgi:hypothetical protein
MRPVDYAKLTEIKCSCCKKTKPVAEFHKFKDASAPLTGWRYYSRCIACNRSQCKTYASGNRPKRNARLRTWRKNNPAKARLGDRKKALQRNYGLTLEQAGELYERAGHKCEMCDGNARLCIDHCHTTGRVRGILCASCNTFIGRIENNSTLLAKLEAYLKTRCHK